MAMTRTRKLTLFIFVAVAITAAGVLTWLTRQLAAPVAGIPCETTTADAAEAEGLSFHHTMASMRDSVNGVLVVAAVGEPYIDCKMVFSTFYCEQQGPATVRVLAGNARGFFKIPDGRNGILQGNGDGAMSCTLPDAG